MTLTIQASSLFVKRSLSIKKDRVIFYESAFIGGRRSFRFNEIECVLMGQDDTLSFQVGREVFSLKIKPKKSKHQKTLDALLQGIRETI